MASLTTTVTVAVSLPPELVAVMVKTFDAKSTVGVPEITPVLVSKFNPVGRSGETVHEITAPPLEVGVTVDIATSFVKLKEFGE